MMLQSLLPLTLRIAFFLLVVFSVGCLVWILFLRYNQRHLLLTRLSGGRKHGVLASEIPGGRNLLAWLLPAVTLRRMRISFEERQVISGLSVSWSLFLMMSLTLAAVFFGVGLIYFDNLLAAFCLSACGFFLLDQVLSIGATRHLESTHAQLQMTMQLFATEYRTSRTVQRAMLDTAVQLPEPIRRHIERAAKRLNHGEPANVVLEDLNRSLNHPFARLFIQACLDVMENSQAAPLFDRLAHTLNEWRIRQTKNRAVLAAGKTLGLILNLALIPVYILNVRIQPETHAFFTDVPLGRGLVVLICIGMLLTFQVNRYLSSSDW